MIYQVYAVRDDKAACFAPPFFMQRDGQAVRAFSDAVNDRSTMLSRHPGDYQLYCLGRYDDNTGQFENELPRLIGAARDFLDARPGPLFEGKEV